jgi:hypothetical protein
VPELRPVSEVDPAAIVREKLLNDLRDHQPPARLHVPGNHENKPVRTCAVALIRRGGAAAATRCTGGRDGCGLYPERSLVLRHPWTYPQACVTSSAIAQTTNVHERPRANGGGGI